MRPGLIAAIVAVVVVIGGYLWYSNAAEQSRLELEQAAQVAAEQERSRQEAAAAEQAAREAEEAEALAAEEAAPEAVTPEEQALQATETPANGDDVIVVGDEITEGDIVVSSETAAPVTLDPEQATNTVEIIGTDEAVTEPGTAVGTGPVAETPATAGTEVATEDAATEDAATLLTPENFDRNEILQLINTSDALNEGQRSTLSALIEGASANPAMMQAALATIRDALGLPPAN